MRNARSRGVYAYFAHINTRWMDNDAYGHVNNVVYYSFFDTAVNQHLIHTGSLDIQGSPVIGLVVDTQCQYFKPLAFPDAVHVGVKVASVGNTSVRYEVGLFVNDAEEASAEGHFVHVYVDRATGKPAPIPDKVREALGELMGRAAVIPAC